MAAHKNSLHSVTFNVTYLGECFFSHLLNQVLLHSIYLLEEKITLTRDSESGLFTCPCEQFQTKDTKRLGEHIKRAHSSLVKRSGARVTSDHHASYSVNRPVVSKEIISASFSAGHSLESDGSSIQNLVSGPGSNSGSGSGSAMDLISNVPMDVDEDIASENTGQTSAAAAAAAGKLKLFQMCIKVIFSVF